MAPFLAPKSALSGFKERIDSLLVQGDRLYVGTATGGLHIYGVDNEPEEGSEILTLVEVKKGLARKSIEQLGFVKEINSLVVLSEATVTLFPLPGFTPPTILTNAKAAFSFAVHTCVQHLLPDDPTEVGFTKSSKKSIPTLVTRLVVGCRRKVVIYSWKDGDPQEVKEYALPHSPRVISFIDNDHACFAYPANEYAIFSFDKLTATEVTMPLPAAGGPSSMGTFTGLTGYMTLGLGAKAKPGVVHFSDNDTLILRDNEGIIIGKDAKPTGRSAAVWSAPPEELAFLKPYLFAVLPPGSLPAKDNKPLSDSAQVTQMTSTTAVQIRSSISFLPTQTFIYPFNLDSGPDPTSAPSVSQPSSNATVRLLTPSSAMKSLLYLVTTPTDRTAAANDGSTIWQIWMKPWTEQIDELVQSGQYAYALKLLETIEEAVLPDKDKRRTLIRMLNAVTLFRSRKFDEAIDEFIELNVNPAKVVALYPESIAGRLSVPSEQWITLYGGPASPTPPDDAVSTNSSSQDAKEKEKEKEKITTEQEASTSAESVSAGSGSALEKGITASGSAASELLENLGLQGGTGTLRGRLRNQLGAYLGSAVGGAVAAQKDDDAASIRSNRSGPQHKPKSTPVENIHNDLNRSVESLLRFLGDRRPRLAGALAAVGVTPADQAHTIAPLSETSVEDLFATPSVQLSALTPEQLLRYAQIVDTALFKSYLLVRPSLAGSLFRIANWCEVEEVEGILKERRMFGNLRDLYHQKKMHRKALELLRQLGEKEEDMESRLDASIQYLKRLGPEYLDQIFESSRWLFEQDSKMALEVFKSEDTELPREAVADYLENMDPNLCAQYLEYLIQEREENSQEFHDRLAVLYAKMTIAARKRGDENLYEARAILLGRMGRHDQALELYVYRLREYFKAEEYCKRYYKANTPTSNVFLTLLRIYLRPTVKTNIDFLQPALDLISRHSPRLDTVEALQLLPPMVTTQDIRTFLIEGLRIPVFDAHVMRSISKARDDQLSRSLMALQLRRVKVTDSRICPQCKERLPIIIVERHLLGS
ncbi:Vacuolar morphogenesis protein 6 [Marasmius crinis-equi]|uniref:Vacuolar morphogenesis protein 6 n=1 Tax=Marasmius crinis-equi TaxID=585013 RepID=A0ABR3FRB4_9AGAR